jgi:hypothetical protein
MVAKIGFSPQKNVQYIKDVWEQDARENVWAQEGGVIGG